MNKKNLDKELFDWNQKKLEEGDFPCACTHFKKSHIKNLCIGCHGDETHPASSHGEGWAVGSCFHAYKQMDNLTLVEWMSKNKDLK